MAEHVVIYSDNSSESLDFGDQPIEASLPVVSKSILISSTDGSFCGQIKLTSASSVVQGPNITDQNGFLVIPHPDTDTSNVWVFPHGATKENGYPLASGANMILQVGNLNYCDFQLGGTLISGCLCWMKG